MQLVPLGLSELLLTVLRSRHSISFALLVRREHALAQDVALLFGECLLANLTLGRLLLVFLD